jgi:hypothetical protein
VTGAPAQHPAGRITVTGRPSAAELAALTAVLLALRGASAEPTDDAPAGRPSGWLSRTRRLRLPPAPGPGAWRAGLDH